MLSVLCTTTHKHTLTQPYTHKPANTYTYSVNMNMLCVNMKTCCVWFLSQVYCHHEGSGCIWRGRLCDVDSHLTSSCPRVLLPCPNDCGELINRESIPSHLAESCTRRSAFCAYCNTEGPLDFITDEHHKVCPKVLLSCPNRCPTGKVLRDELQGHLEECPLQSVQCEFNCFGCEEVLERKGLDSHMSSAQTRHLLLAMKRVSEMGQQLEVWQGNTEQLREELQRSHNEIENLREIVQTLQTQHPSNGVGGAGRISSNLVPPRQTRRLLMEKHLEASAEICQQDHFLPVVLKMDDFSFYSTNREPWYSHPFYSQPLGYKFCLCVYASGICSGQFTHLSAYVHLVAGEFDDSQEWPLQLGLTIELQNQLADKDHWGADCEFRRGGGSQQISQRVARGRARRGAGSATLIRLDKLGLNAAFSNCHYLRNNQLYFNVY